MRNIGKIVAGSEKTTLLVYKRDKVKQIFQVRY